MLVYRISSEQEINQILKDQSFINIGKTYNRDEKVNTHLYVEGKQYIHFFKDYDSIFYLYVTKGCYIVTYDIPEELLNQNKGIGYYYDRTYMEKLESVEEYSIPKEQVHFSYLIGIDKVIEPIEFEDYYCDDYKNKLLKRV